MFFALTNKKILLVDDSSIMRMVLSLHLRRFTGVQITEAVNGVEALALLAQEHFDLLLTDLNMPEMTGIDLIRHVRGGLKSGIPIVIITTRGEAKDRDFGLSLGADSYLTKPVVVKDLILTVYNYLGARKGSPVIAPPTNVQA